MNENHDNSLKLLLKQLNRLSCSFIINCKLFKTLLLQSFRKIYQYLKRSQRSIISLS